MQDNYTYLALFIRGDFMKIILCNCEQCRAGRHKWKRVIRAHKKGARRTVHKLLRQGCDNLPVKVYVGYTD